MNMVGHEVPITILYGLKLYVLLVLGFFVCFYSVFDLLILLKFCVHNLTSSASVGEVKNSLLTLK